MNLKQFSFLKLCMIVLASTVVFSACKNNSVSSIEEDEPELAMYDGSDLLSNTEVVNNVYISDNTVDTYDPLFPATADPDWQNVVCKQSNNFGITATWSNPHKAFQVTKDPGYPDYGGPHPWESSTFDAYWINTVNDMDSPDTKDINGNSGPDGHNWTRYEKQVSGNGDFSIELLADNCSWVYLADENGNTPQLVGFQGAVSTPGNYGVELNGDHKLIFIIYDGGGLAGGKFRLETTENPPPPIVPEEPEVITYTSQAGISSWGPVTTDNNDWRNVKCTDAGALALDDPSWGAEHDAYNIRNYFGGDGSAAFERFWEGIYSQTNFGGEWIYTADRGDSPGPNYSKYEMSVEGNGTFELKLLADDCSWIYLDGELVGYQDDAGLDNPENTRYGLTLDGTHTLTYIIYDQGGQPGGKFLLETTTEDIPVYVPPTPVNTAPTANAGSDQTVTATGQTTSVTLNGSASSDPDGGDALSYSWNLNGNEVATSASPSVDLADGDYTFTLTVSDGELSDSDDVNVTVVNTVPVADAGEDISKNATGSTTSIDLDGSGSSDADGDDLSYLWTLDGNEVANSETASIDLADGDYTITLTVSDGQADPVTDVVNVSVVNTIPVANAGEDISKNATSSTTSIDLDGSGSTDADGDDLIYSWTLNGNEVANTETATIDLADGDYTITLTVSDGQADPVTDIVNVSVVNTIPVANAGDDITEEATGPTTSVTLTGSGSDADDDVLTYSWSNGDTGTSTTVNLGVGVHSFTLTVSDEQGASHSDEVTVEITDTTAPVITFNAETNSLWPPNHKMVLVASGISASDIVDGSLGVTVTVESSEASNGKGDGNTDSDYEIVTHFDGSVDVYVRSERSGKGNSGRTYTINMSVTDAAGMSSSDSIEVSVAKSQGNSNNSRGRGKN